MLRNPVSSQPIARRQPLISGSMIKPMTKNNRGLVDLRDLLRVNQTKQRITGHLEIVNKRPISL
jgi:hypothetical protein